MDDIKLLHEKRVNVGKQINKLTEDVQRSNDGAGRDFKPEEMELFDKLEAEYNGLQSKIDTAERIARGSSLNSNRTQQRSAIIEHGVNFGNNDITEWEKSQALQGWMMAYTGKGKPTIEQRSALAKCGLDGHTSQLELFGRTEQRTSLTTGTNSAGGYLVQAGLIQGIEAVQKTLGGLISAAKNVTTASGESIPWLYYDDTAVSGRSHTINTDLTTSDDPSFSAVNITSAVKQTNVIPVPRELVQDSAFPMLEMLSEMLALRLDRSMASDAHTALIAGTTVGVTATDSSYNITEANIFDLEAAIDPYYWRNASFAMNVSTLTYFKKLVDSTGRSLWQPAMSASLGNRSQDTLHGYPIVLDQYMDSLGTISHIPVVFGDMSKLVVRSVGSLDVQVLYEKYATQYGYGVIAFKRYGCGVVLPKALSQLSCKAS